MSKLYYKSGFKYQLAEDYKFEIDLPVRDFSTNFIAYFEGFLIIDRGYAWDGPSTNLTFDDKTNLRASLEHDVLYQLIRNMFLPRSFRKQADLQFNKTAKEDGMNFIRRWYYLRALRMFAGFAADPKNVKKTKVCGK